MDPVAQGCDCLNPWKYEINCKSKTVAIVTIALSAILVIAGVFAILSSIGVSVHPFNALSALGMGVGGIIALIGGVILSVGVAWVVTKKPALLSKASPEVYTKLQQMSADFLQDKNHEAAKQNFRTAMQEHLQATVEFPKAGRVDNPETLTGNLNGRVFLISTGRTRGVQENIPIAAQDSEHIHIFQGASQYNSAEAAGVFTPPVGQAVETVNRHNDGTQGPLAQGTNPDAFEFANAFLANYGFNMLEYVLVKNRAAVHHGYLLPNNGNIQQVTEEFIANYHQTEYVCYQSKSERWGDNVYPVYIFLQAAPAISYSSFPPIGLTAPSHELQKYTAFANYLALFRHGIQLSRKTNKPVILHPTAVGGSAFGNAIENIKWGFKKAALALQGEMEASNVKVLLDGYTMELIGDG